MGNRVYTLISIDLAVVISYVSPLVCLSKKRKRKDNILFFDLCWPFARILMRVDFIFDSLFTWPARLPTTSYTNMAIGYTNK